MAEAKRRNSWIKWVNVTSPDGTLLHELGIREGREVKRILVTHPEDGYRYRYETCRECPKCSCPKINASNKCNAKKSYGEAAFDNSICSEQTKKAYKPEVRSQLRKQSNPQSKKRRLNEDADADEDSFRKKIELEPGNAALHYSFAKFLIEGNRFGEAVTELKESIVLEPINSSHHFRLAVVLDDHLGLFEEAEIEFNKSMELDPRNPIKRRFFGLFLEEKLGRFAEAEPEFRKAIELDPKDPDNHFFYACFLQNVGRFTESRAEFEEERKLDPESEKDDEDSAECSEEGEKEKNEMEDTIAALRREITEKDVIIADLRAQIAPGQRPEESCDA